MASLAVEPPTNPDEGPRVRCRLDIVQPSRIVTDAAGAGGVARRTTPTSPSWTASTGYNAPGALLRVLPGRCSAGTTVIRVLVAEDDEFQRMAIASRFRAANDANVAPGSTVQFEALLVRESEWSQLDDEEEAGAAPASDEQQPKDVRVLRWLADKFATLTFGEHPPEERLSWAVAAERAGRGWLESELGLRSGLGFGFGSGLG